MPSRLRGRIDLYINGSYWLGAVLGSGVSLIFLDEDLLPAEVCTHVITYGMEMCVVIMFAPVYKSFLLCHLCEYVYLWSLVLTLTHNKPPLKRVKWVVTFSWEETETEYPY